MLIIRKVFWTAVVIFLSSTIYIGGDNKSVSSKVTTILCTLSLATMFVAGIARIWV